MATHVQIIPKKIQKNNNNNNYYNMPLSFFFISHSLRVVSTVVSRLVILTLQFTCWVDEINVCPLWKIFLV